MRWLLGALALCSNLAWAVAVPERPVEAFDTLSETTTDPPGGVWSGTPGEDAGRIRFRRVPAEREGTNGQALRLDYAFGPEDSGAIGYRLDLGGLDATGYDHLALWVRGDPAAGFADGLKIELHRPRPGGRGLVETGSFLIEGIGPDWRRVLIPLNRMVGLRERDGLSALVLVLQARRSPVRRGAFLIDDIALVRTGEPGPSAWDRVIPPRKRAWEAAHGGEDAARPLVKARLAGWPERLLVDRSTLPSSDRALLERLAADTWRGIAALSDREHGLPLDSVQFRGGSLAVEQARIGDYTSATNIGLYLMAVAAAHDLGLIGRDEALERLARTLATLERLETHQGHFYNFYDTTTLERSSNFLSFVDSAWLTAGLMVARQAFPETAARATRLIEGSDFGFFYDPILEQMWHGHYVNLGAPSEYHYGALYTESRIGNLIAIGKGDAPAGHWFRMSRTFPGGFLWQSLPPRGVAPKTVAGHRFTGGWYEWRGRRYVPSWGGSLFEALMPRLVLDEQAFAPDSLGVNGQVHAELQRLHALEDLGYPVWGLSPSATPDGAGYGEYGVPKLGSLGYGAGAVSPYAAALALLAEPEAATKNLRRIVEDYDAYGDFGLYDALDPRTGQVAHKYLVLDQAMILLALANHLADGAVQRRFAADPIARRALPLIREERFFEPAPALHPGD